MDDKVVQYIPVFGSYGKNYVTIRHCLTHMTGIQSDPFKQASVTAKRKYNSLEEEVADFAKKEIQKKRDPQHPCPVTPVCCKTVCQCGGVYGMGR